MWILAEIHLHQHPVGKMVRAESVLGAGAAGWHEDSFWFSIPSPSCRRNCVSDLGEKTWACVACFVTDNVQ